MEQLEKVFINYLAKEKEKNKLKREEEFEKFKEYIVEFFPDNIKIINTNLILNTKNISNNFIIKLTQQYKSLGFKNLILLLNINNLSKEEKYIFKNNKVFYLDFQCFKTISQFEITKLIKEYS